jgi:eukaryotic-like serine/threonine-protein kinase
MLQVETIKEVIPAQIGRYRVAAHVVSATFSRVFRAHDADLNRWVAIKLFSLTPEQAAHTCFDVPEWRRRFVLEAEVLSNLDHPHVIHVDELGWHAGEPFMVMPYMAANLRREIGLDIDGPGLASYERPRALSPDRAVAVLAQLASALAAIHAAGLVHRDVKPTNLLLDQPEGGTVKLCDFGMIKVAGRPEPLQMVWFGSPDYMSPEQGCVAGLATDRSDVYSAGVLAYRLLTGRLPAPNGPPFPEELRPLVAQMMAPNPSRRPSAAEVASRLMEIHT